MTNFSSHLYLQFFAVNEDFDALTSYFFRFENSRVAEINIPTYRDADTSEGTESFSVHVVSETIPIGVELDPSRASTLVNIMNFVGKELVASSPTAALMLQCKWFMCACV